jgi:UrcA family protein
MIIKNIASAAFFALLAVWVAAPFASAQTVAQSREASRQVLAADPDLRFDAGQATLRHRIQEAVNQVCGVPDPRGRDDARDFKGCRRLALRQAMAQAGVRLAGAHEQFAEFAAR